MNIPIDTAYTLFAVLVDATDDETPETALTGLTTEYCKSDGSAFSSFTPTSTTEIGDGVYKIVVPASVIDTDGEIVFRVLKSGTSNTFRTVRRVVDYSAEAEKRYLDDVAIARIAAAVLTTKRSTAIANSINSLSTAPHNDHREALVGAIAQVNGQWTLSGLTLTVKGSGGDQSHTRTLAGTVDADAASLATGVSA